MKRLLIEIVVCILLISLVGFLFNSIQTLTSDNKRLTENQDVLLSRYDSLNVSYLGKVHEVRALNLTVSELKEQLPELQRQLSRMSVKYKQATNITTSTSQIGLEFIPDTIWIVPDPPAKDDSPRDSILRYEYSNPWITFKMDTSILINVFDTTVIVQHYKQRKFLWFKWDRKDYVSILHTNPYIKSVETSINLK